MGVRERVQVKEGAAGRSAVGRIPPLSARRSYGAVTRKAGSCDSLQVEKPHDGLTVVLPTREGDLSSLREGLLTLGRRQT